MRTEKERKQRSESVFLENDPTANQKTEIWRRKRQIALAIGVSVKALTFNALLCLRRFLKNRCPELKQSLRRDPRCAWALVARLWNVRRVLCDICRNMSPDDRNRMLTYKIEVPTNTATEPVSITQNFADDYDADIADIFDNEGYFFQDMWQDSAMN